MFYHSDARHAKPDFYVMDIEDEDDSAQLLVMKVKELGKLDESYITVINL